MHAVVSLFDEPTTEAVKNVWTELANDFGVRHLSDVLPYPHFSYQIAQQYEEQELVGHVEDLAQQATPFQIQAGGLALFTGPHLVLYVPVVRTFELSQFHQIVWQAITPAGSGISPYYQPATWTPHITLAEHDIEPESLSRIIARLSRRQLLWEISVDNLAIIWDTGTRRELRSPFHFQQRGKTKATRRA
ncbi:MAG TPA: 2'-5' RNA ligase family protein [Ktedonobacteraceae bacterium]